MNAKRNMTAIIISVALATAWGVIPKASAQPVVERPFLALGAATICLDVTDPYLGWTKTHSGVGTHAGWYTGDGSGNALGGSGTVTVANGDTVDWSVVFTAVNLDFASMTAQIAGTVTWEGGTGRFTDASGSASLAYQGTMEFAGPGVLKLTLTYEMKGTIVY